MLSKALPERVEPRALARDNVVLEGTVALVKFERMAEYLCEHEGDADVHLEFHLRSKNRVVIRGHLRAMVAMECQYCLEEVKLEIQADLDLVAAENDDQVRELSETGEAMLLSGDQVPLVGLIEDDLILALPMVARHGDGECIEKLGYHVEEVGIDHPFAALASLKKELQGGDTE